MRSLASLPLIALLAACTVGPDYKGPPVSAGSTATGFARSGSAAATGVTTGAPAVADWWTTLNDPLLDSLEQRLTGLVGLTQGRNEVQASARVIETADEVLGTLIDTRA